MVLDWVKREKSDKRDKCVDERGKQGGLGVLICLRSKKFGPTQAKLNQTTSDIDMNPAATSSIPASQDRHS